MKGIIDRIEERYAVVELENMSIIHVERKALPEKAKEGDVLIMKEGTIHIDHEGTYKRKNKMNKLMQNLINKGQKK